MYEVGLQLHVQHVYIYICIYKYIHMRSRNVNTNDNEQLTLYDAALHPCVYMYKYTCTHLRMCAYIRGRPSSLKCK